MRAGSLQVDTPPGRRHPRPHDRAHAHAGSASDFDELDRHRRIWESRPELRAVYRQWFRALAEAVGGASPVVEIGAGPGFFKEFLPSTIATDIVSTSWTDVVCDGCALPFREATVGAIVMVDALHHLSRPLDFMTEAERVLRPGGRVAAVEPWITPLSFLLYRFFHHEDCCLGVDLRAPFAGDRKKRALEGNAAIPWKLVKSDFAPSHRLRLLRRHPFLALPYLVTLGFHRERRVPEALLRVAEAGEWALRVARHVAATRVLVVWDRV